MTVAAKQGNTEQIRQSQIAWCFIQQIYARQRDELSRDLLATTGMKATLN